jgi:hypothetical protein
MQIGALIALLRAVTLPFLTSIFAVFESRLARSLRVAVAIRAPICLTQTSEFLSLMNPLLTQMSGESASVEIQARGLRNRTRSLASVECRMKTVDKASALEVDRLVQEADGSAVQRACLNRLVAIGRYENDWYVKAEMRQTMLQLYAAHVRQLHIQYQTPRFGHYRRLQKRLG